MTTLNLLRTRKFGLTSEIKSIILNLKKEGVIPTFKKYKLKALALIFFYYLTRDLIIYVLIPWIILRYDIISF